MMATKRVVLSACLVLTLSGTALAQQLLVLVTNDDGIGAPGIAAVVDALALNPNLQVEVFAPATNQSGVSDTFTAPPSTIGVAAGTTATGFPGTAVSGTPADAVMYALLVGLPQPPDIVVSGINLGQNIGSDTVEKASGTVGAALTAGRRGIPAIAASLGVPATDYSAAARYVANVVENFRAKRRLRRRMASKNGLDQSLVLNVNFPTCTTGAVRGVAVVPEAYAQTLAGSIVTSYTMTGPGTFLPVLSSTNAFASDCTSSLTKPTTDIEAMNNGFASVTPLNPTLTVNSSIRRFRFLAKIPFN
jgi:5'-nucleotidase